MSETPEIKKVIIPVAGLGTRFLPLSLVTSKEFFPLVDKPIIQYIVQEVKNSGIRITMRTWQLDTFYPERCVRIEKTDI